jgi:hypothetical protein
MVVVGGGRGEEIGCADRGAFGVISRQRPHLSLLTTALERFNLQQEHLWLHKQLQQTASGITKRAGNRYNTLQRG